MKWLFSFLAQFNLLYTQWTIVSDNPSYEHSRVLHCFRGDTSFAYRGLIYLTENGPKGPPAKDLIDSTRNHHHAPNLKNGLIKQFSVAVKCFKVQAHFC